MAPPSYHNLLKRAEITKIRLQGSIIFIYARLKGLLLSRHPVFLGLLHLQRGKTRKNDPIYAWTLKKKTWPTSGSFPHMLKVVFCARAASGYLRPQPAFPPLQQEGTTLLFIGGALEVCTPLCAAVTAKGTPSALVTTVISNHC